MGIAKTIGRMLPAGLRRGRFSAYDEEVRQLVHYIGHHPVYLSTLGATEDQAGNIDKNVSVAIRLISDAICQLPIVVEQKVATPSGIAWEAVEDHPLAERLKYPNEFHDSGDFVKHIIQSLILTGVADLTMPKGMPGDGPLALMPVPMTMMQLKYDKSGAPSHFVFDPSRQRIRFEFDEVLHFRLYDAQNPFEGKSMVKPIMDMILSTMHAIDINKQFFKNGALLSMLFSYQDNALDWKPEDEERFLKSFRAAFTGGTSKSNKIGLIPKGLKVEQAMASMKDMMFAELIKLNREEIFSQLGIPPSEGGIYEYANYANAMVQKRSFWENTILPKLTLIQKGIDRQMIRRFWPEDDIRVRFVTDNVGALKEDQLTKARVDEIYIRTGKSTVNELRRRDGQDDVEWGDEPPQNYQPTPIDPANQDQPVSGSNAFAAVKGTRGVRSRSFDRTLRGYEVKCANLFANYFAQQRRRVIAKLKEKTSGGLMMSAALFTAIHLTKDDDALPDHGGAIFNIASENKELGTKAKPFYKKVVKSVGQETVRAIGVKVSFNVDDPGVTTMVGRLWNRSELINDATFEDIKGLLRQAYDEKWDLSKLTTEINGLYDEYGRTRAELIARTEMHGVVNGSTYQAYDQAGIEEQEWLASIDEATRESHAAADGQVVPLNQPFIVDGESLFYPGDPAGSAGNTINCRCTTIPVIKEK